jgi:hypothetical protein
MSRRGRRTAHRIPGSRQVFGGAVCGDGWQALIAGQVRLVDQTAQGVCDLAGPDRLRVGLGGVFQVPEQVLGGQLVTDAVEGVVIGVPVVHHDGAVQVGIESCLKEGRSWLPRK